MLAVDFVFDEISVGSVDAMAIERGDFMKHAETITFVRRPPSPIKFRISHAAVQRV